jgi:hypothetical protein
VRIACAAKEWEDMLMRVVHDVNTFFVMDVSLELPERTFSILNHPQLNVIASGYEVTSLPASK